MVSTDVVRTVSVAVSYNEDDKVYNRYKYCEASFYQR